MTKKKKAPIPPSLNQFKLIQASSPTELNRAPTNTYNRPNYKPKPCYKLRSCLRRFLRSVCPSCLCGTQYKHDIRGTSRSRGRKRGRVKTICCPPWNCFPFCCCISQRSPATDSSEDICNLIRNCGTTNNDDHLDIDQYVAWYRQSEQSQLPATPTTPTSAGPQPPHALPRAVASSSQSTTPEVHKRGKKKLMKHIWNWNDSLKSNSDSFLESLEYDAMVNGGSGVGGGGSKSNSLKKYRKITNCSNIEGTFIIFLLINGRHFYICHASIKHNLNFNLMLIKLSVLSLTEELAASPERAATPTKDVASPTRSQGSSKTDAWPSQSDDDIDRLVAMHRHRNSLSSLGVSGVAVQSF